LSIEKVADSIPVTKEAWNDIALVPPFVASGGQLVDGLRIVPSSQVTVNTFVIGDFRYGTIYDLDDITVEIGFVNDQFIKNSFTVLAKQRLAL
jgi:hypothetical protein